jgi:hypothetical protein
LGFGLIARVLLSKDGVYSIELTPFQNDNLKVNYIPRPASQAQAKTLYKEIMKPLKKNYKRRGSKAYIKMNDF